MGEFYVYVHLTAGGVPFYVGKGKGGRAYAHHKRNKHWRASVRKYGLVVEILHTNLPEEEALQLEIAEIAWFRQYYSLTNICDGGGGVTNNRQTNEHKRGILAFCEAYGRMPSRHGANSDERRLYWQLANYCSPSKPTYDPVFHQEMQARGYRACDTESHKRDIRDFYVLHGRLPRDIIPAEARICRTMRLYCSPSSPAYDPAFHAEMTLCGYRQADPASKKQAIRDFYAQNGRLPTDQNAEERRMRRWMYRYCAHTDKCYDQEFLEEMVGFGYKLRRQ